MKFEKLFYLARRTKGDYQHDECSISAVVEDGDDINKCLDAVKVSVYSWISSAQAKIEAPKNKVESPKAKVEETKVEQPEEPKEEPKKDEKKATRKTSTKTKKEDPKTEEPKEESPSEEPSEVTIDMVREALQSVWKTKGKAIANEVLAKFSANKISEIQSEQYASVLKECDIALKS